MAGNRDDYCRNLKFDLAINIATTPVMNSNHQYLYNPNPPPAEGLFLLLDDSAFLLLDGETMSLL